MLYREYFSNCYAAPDSTPMPVLAEKVINQDEMDALCPLDPTKGKRSEPLVRALDSSCSDSERNALLSSLQLVKTSSGYESLSDEVKLLVCKLRTLQTPSELKDFAGFVNQICDNMEIDVPETPETPQIPETPETPDGNGDNV